MCFCALQDRLLKPLAGFTGYSNEMRELAAVISRVRYNDDVVNGSCMCMSILPYVSTYYACVRDLLIM